MIRRYWPRMIEGSLGAWLIASPWVLDAPDAPAAEVLGIDLVTVGAGMLLIALMFTSFRFRRTQIAVLLTGFLLALWNWLAYPRPGPPTAENGIIVGLIVCLFALVPNEPGQPPVAWRPFVRPPKEPG